MSFTDHLPVLVVLVPLLVAPLCSLIRRPHTAWSLATMATWTTAGIAIQLLRLVLAGGTMRYQLGGWEPPWGIEYRIDLLGAYVLVIITVIAALVLSFARRSVDSEIPDRRIPTFYAVFLLCLTGLAGMTVTGDAFNVFVFLEISSLSSYAMISMGRDRRALNAAFQYLIMGSIGATFILIGIGFLYMMTGTLNMDDLAARLPEVAETRTIRAGFAFLTVGFGLKLALFPLHLWLPNAYAYAPSAVSAFLAATATKVAVYCLLRFLLSIFGIDFSLGAMPLDAMLMALGVAGVLSASLVAIFQRNVKRMLAYSSVAQIGYIALGIGLANHEGLSAGMMHLFNHAMMKGALFMALGAVAYRTGSMRVADFGGLGRQMPLTMAAFLLAGLSLIGIPGTAGFISKWYLVTGTLERGFWPLAVVVLIGSFLALIYIGRVLEKAYFGKPAEDRVVREAPLGMLIPIWLLVLANLYFGFNTELSAGLASMSAAELTEVLR